MTGPCLSPPPGGLGPPRAGAGVGRWPLGRDASGCLASSPHSRPTSLEKPISLPGSLGESQSPGPSGAASRLLPPAPSGPVSPSFSSVCIPSCPGVTLAAFRPAPRRPDAARPPPPPPCPVSPAQVLSLGLDVPGGSPPPALCSQISTSPNTPQTHAPLDLLPRWTPAPPDSEAPLK